MLQKTKFSVSLTLILIMIMIFGTTLQATTVDFNTIPGMSTTTETVRIGGKTFTFTVLWVDSKDEKIRIETATKDNKIGSTATLGALIESATDLDGHVYAGISGGNFDYKDDFQPDGTIIVDKTVKHIGNNGSLFTYSSAGNINLFDTDIKLNLTVKAGSDEEVYFESTLINHFVPDPNSILYFTADYDGPRPSHDMYSVQCDQGIISTVSIGDFDIPTEGFTLLIPDSVAIEHFEVSNAIESNFEHMIDGKTTDFFEYVRTGLGAGPLLVKNSVKQTNLSTAGIGSYHSDSLPTTRGLIGVGENGLMGIATVENVTLNELATIAVEIGMTNAMQLNYGPTSTMMINKISTVSTDIKISSALVIKRLFEQPIKVELNGKPVFFDAEPYLDRNYDRTLVPLRKIAEALGADVGWEAETRSVLINRHDTLLKLQTDSRTVYVNGVPTTMELPMVNRNSRSYVPVRFITEYFGGEVGWNGATNTVLLNISTLDGLFNAADDYLAEGKSKEAMEKYLEILELDPNNLRATKALAEYYTETSSSLTEKIDWNQKVLDIEPTDQSALSAMAFAYADVGLVDEAVEWFIEYLTYYPKDSYHHYGLALQYSSFQLNNVAKAKEHFQLAIDYGLMDSRLEFAEDYLEKH